MLKTAVRKLTCVHTQSSITRLSSKVSFLTQTTTGLSIRTVSASSIKMAPKENKATGPVETRGSEDPESASTLKQPESDDDSWKEQDPYRINEDNDEFETVHEGSCHCGKVKYLLSREVPLSSKFCHCTTCQRLHGAPFQWAAIFHKSDIRFTKGHHDLVWYDPGEKTTRHKLPCKVSCAHCRSPIMDEGRNMILLFPPLITFKSKQARDKWAPSVHMFYKERIVDIKDGKPKLEGLDSKDKRKEMPKDLW